MVPKDHPAYIEAGNGFTGRRKEEVVLEIRDMSHRWGRAHIANERFTQSSPLFDAVLELFNAVWTHASMIGPPGAADRLSYPHAIQHAVTLLSSTK